MNTGKGEGAVGSLKLFAVVLTFSLAPIAFGAEVIGFQTWKAARVDDARAAVEKLQSERNAGTSASSTASKRSEAPKSGDSVTSRLQPTNKNSRGDAKVQQAQTTLELAQELNVNDYFVLYLSQLKGRDAFIEAAKKLTPEEAADLMMAYLKHLRNGGASYDDLPPPSAAGLAVPASATKVITN